MNVKIKRQRTPESQPYWQTFVYNGSENVPVSAILEAINYTDDLFDAEGNPAPRIRWECGCMQAVCGGCAMVINGIPALACEFFAGKLKGHDLVLEPLSKFPVVSDLIVDRSVIFESLNRAQAYLPQSAAADPKQHDHQYSAAKCLKCGLCLEVCPNYKPDGEFFGAVFANESYLLCSLNSERNAAAEKAYQKHFSSGCSKALSCQKVCPVGMDTLSTILKMNRK